MEVEIGHPLIIKNVSGMKKHGLVKNMKGFCNNVVTVEGEGTYVMFQPDGVERFFWISIDRVVVDEDRLPKIEEEGPSSA